MNYFRYDSIFDKISLYEGLAKNTLTVRLEGNIGERCPSERHRYDISLPAAVGEYEADFAFYVPKHRYRLCINSINRNSMDITFNGSNYTLHEGENLLWIEKEYQASYDGPWFTAEDCLIAVWLK